MSKFKKVLEVCAVDVMAGGGFLISGVLCLVAEAYDGAAVCAAVVIVAGVIGVMQWKRRARVTVNQTDTKTPYYAQPGLPEKPKRSRPKTTPRNRLKNAQTRKEVEKKKPARKK